MRYHDLCALRLRGWFNDGVVAEPEYALLHLVERGVRPILAVAENHRPIGTALIAYDGSSEAAKAMKRFIQMNLWQSCRAHIVIFSRPDDKRRQVLENAATYARSDDDVTATTAPVDATPLEGIPAEADKVGSDLPVMATAEDVRGGGTDGAPQAEWAA